jgi:hypothetical protein
VQGQNDLVALAESSEVHSFQLSAIGYRLSASKDSLLAES